MLGQDYKDQYEGYYTDELDRKRDLTAIETAGHIRELVADRKYGSIVDIGAGQGGLVGVLHHEGRAEQFTALEISTSGLDKIRHRDLPNVSAVPFDGYHTDFPDKAFDLAISIHVLEHVEHERLYLHELRRISRQAIIEVPLELTANPRKTLKIMAPFGHINFYTRTTAENLLRTSGLEIRQAVVNTLTPEMDRFLSGRVKGDLKNRVRRTALRLNQGFAMRRFVYLYTALVDCG
jgi:trans-aconitate methyltransferase